MIIGIDFDGVLTDLTNFIDSHGEEFAKRNNIAVKKNENAFTTKDMFGWTDEDDENFWRENDFIYTKHVAPNIGVSEALKKLHELGNKLIIVSARYNCDQDTPLGEQMRAISTQWLNDNKIYYDEIYYVGSLSKVPTVIDKKIDIFIDDFVKNLDEISKIIPVICFNARYNKSYENKNMTRCSNWAEIVDFITSKGN